MSQISSEPVRPGSLTLEQARKIVDAMVEYTTVTKPGGENNAHSAQPSFRCDPEAYTVYASRPQLWAAPRHSAGIPRLGFSLRYILVAGVGFEQTTSGL